MNNSLIVIINQNNGTYKNLTVDKHCVLKHNEDCKIISRRKDPKMIIIVDGIFLHYLVQELTYAPYYRTQFIKRFSDVPYVKVELVPVQKEILDYNWNDRIDYLVRERCELEHVLSWLSTLGGAFSALGDYFLNCAEVAGNISINQLKLAFRLGDPTVMARCRLFISLSLIQRCYFKLAKSIIYTEYINAKKSNVIDVRLLNMCKGIWCKLKYEYENYKNCKRRNKK